MLFSHFWLCFSKFGCACLAFFLYLLARAAMLDPRKPYVKGGRASKLALNLFSGPSSGTLFEYSQKETHALTNPVF